MGSMLYGLIAFVCLLILFACITVDLVMLALGWPKWRR